MKGYFSEFTDQSSIVRVDPSGLPKAWSIIPAPMKTEKERAAMIEKVRQRLWLHGAWIERESRVKNPVFDKKSEKSSTKIVWRVCQSEDEAKFVMAKIAQILHVKAKAT